MILENKTTIILDREEVLAAIKQYVQRELSDDGQYFEEIEIKANLQIPDFRAECTKNEKL